LTATAKVLDDASASASPIPQNLFGRYMLPDMSEHPCQVTNISIAGAIFVTETPPPPGLTLVAYLEELGRVEAISGEKVPGGFNITFNVKGSRLEKLESRIKWLSQRKSGNEEDRRHARFEPRDNQSQITLPDGRVYNCEVIDISLSGAGVKIDIMPSLGTYIMLGKMRGRVVRYLDNGIGIEFVKQLERPQLSEAS
jgi:hypothetical protein